MPAHSGSQFLSGLLYFIPHCIIVVRFNALQHGLCLKPVTRVISALIIGARTTGARLELLRLKYAKNALYGLHLQRYKPVRT